MTTLHESLQVIGSCHCDAIGYAYRTRIEPSDWTVRACQCGFCRAHGVLTTSDPSGSVEFFEHTAGALARYRFGRRTADFLLCRHCGVYLGAVIDTPHGRFGIININALKSHPADLATAVAADYEGENVEQRIARRERHWTPVLGAV